MIPPSTTPEIERAITPILERFRDHPSYVAYGLDLDGRSMRVYVRGPMPGVPAVSEGVRVVVVPLRQNRIANLESWK